VNQAYPDHATLFFDAQPLGYREGIVVTMPNVDIRLGQALCDLTRGVPIQRERNRGDAAIE